LEYRQLTLEKAASEVHKDKFLAMGYCLAFSFCGYFNTYLRTKKPFNPMLFETFEYHENDIKYITEQVSHHPPISAAFGETPKYQFWGDTRLVSKLGLSGMDISPLGGYNMKFKETGDHFISHKCKSVAKNLVFGTTYVWQYGDMTIKNYATGDTATLNFKEKGWTTSDDFKCDGVMKDSSGKVQYYLEGLWNGHLWAICKNTGKKTVLIEKIAPPKDSEWYYLFPQFSMSLNHLNNQMFNTIAPTDSRLRPDQRAYEHGDIKIAASEKLRLEEKQRAVRKKREAEGVLVKPKWFTEEDDP